MDLYNLVWKINNIQKNDYKFYYNIYDRKYDERGTVDKYGSLGLKYDLSI